MLANVIIVSVSSGSIKRAEASERISQGRVWSATLWITDRQHPLTPCSSRTKSGFIPDCFQGGPNCILTKCRFGPPKLVSQNRWCEQVSMKRVPRDIITSLGKTAWKIEVECQSLRTLQLQSSYQFQLNHSILSKVHIPRTASNYSSARCDMTSHDVVTITYVAYNLIIYFKSILYQLELIENLWLNSVWLTRYSANNQNGSQYLWSIC